MIGQAEFRHLIELCRALRLAQKGNVALGIKPNVEEAARLGTALDVFIANQVRTTVDRNKVRDQEDGG